MYSIFLKEVTQRIKLMEQLKINDLGSENQNQGNTC